MTDTSHKKEGFKKCRSATFSIDGYSFTIGENFAPGPFLASSHTFRWWWRWQILSWEGVGTEIWVGGCWLKGAPGNHDREREKLGSGLSPLLSCSS